MKSRWEPLGEDESDDRHGHGSRDASRESVRDRLKERDNSVRCCLLAHQSVSLETVLSCYVRRTCSGAIFVTL